MGEVVNFPISDTLRSLVSGMGTDRDKLFGAGYASQCLTDQQLFDAYRSNWMPGKIVTIPAEDSISEGRDWQAEQDQIEAIEAEETRLGLWPKLLEAQVKARLWGGAAIYIGTGDQDLQEPLNVESVGKGGLQYLAVVSRREVIAGELDDNPISETFNKPKFYQVNGTQSLDQIHPSRFAVFVGAPHVDPLLTIGPNAGWGDSVLERVYQAVKNADATASNIASLVFEANVDVFGVPDMMSSLSDKDYEQRLIDRFTLSATSKGINKALIRDVAEEYDRKQINFSTLPDVLQKFLEIAAGAADIPVTRFLGTAPSGLGSNGDHSMKMYHKRIATQQKLVMTPAIYKLDECLIRSALGSRPPEVHYTWTPLDQLTEKEQAEVGKINAEATRQYVDSGIFLPEEMRKAATNQIVENSIYPGFDQIIKETGDDFDLGGDDPDDDEDDDFAADAAPRSLYIRRDVVNVAEIRAWAKSQGFETIQDGLHVTVMHTRTPLDWIKVGQADEWTEKAGIEVPAGGPRLMERFGDAVVLQFASSRLNWRHEDIKRLGAETDHPEYQPHITVSWNAPDIDLTEVEPYQGRIVLGPEIFEEVDDNWKAGIKEN
ncbi:phage-related protein (TIGR01555 family) [Labrenzia sp. EL_126]|nr:phage-related protein (TIGR01555 family) [Labrenzia sp. EL_126]